LKLADIKIKTSLSPKEYLGAEYYLLKAYRIEPRNSRVLMAYGDYFYHLGKGKKALEYYEKGRRSDKSFLVYLKMARIYQKWGNFEKARDFLHQAENLNSMDYRVAFELGKFFLETKDLDKAEKYFEMTLKFNPDFREGLMKTIEFYIIREDYASAIQKINELLKLEPENALLYYSLGLCYQELGRYEEAVDFLLRGRKYDFSDEALRIKAEEIVVKNLPLGHEIRKDLAKFYLDKGKEAYDRNLIPEAILLYKRGLRVNPLSLPIRKELAQIYREKGWVDIYARTLKAGLFTQEKNQELKDLIALNQRFIWKTLSYREKIDQYEVQGFLPELYVNEVIKDQDSRHFNFEPEMKELILEGLVNTHSLNVKEITTKELSGLSKKGQLLLRVRFFEDERKIELEGELISLATGNIYKRYQLRRYGNNRLLKSVLELSRQVAAVVKPFGTILDIQEDTAIINIGELQNVKIKDRFLILQSKSVVDDYYSGNPLKEKFIIGEAEVLEVDEKIARVRLYKDQRVVFNLINVNDIVMVKKQENAEKKNQSN
jgi:tetratricopeptide (TPR) repeat protein